MEKAQVEAAVLTLLQQGHALAAISGPMVRQALGGHGSYRDICEHLKAIKQDAGVLVDEPSEASNPHDEAPAPLSDPIVEAEAALSQAQQALQAKMDALPEAEHELAD